MESFWCLHCKDRTSGILGKGATISVDELSRQTRRSLIRNLAPAALQKKKKKIGSAPPLHAVLIINEIDTVIRGISTSCLEKKVLLMCILRRLALAIVRGVFVVARGGVDHSKGRHYDLAACMNANIAVNYSKQGSCGGGGVAWLVSRDFVIYMVGLLGL